MYNVYCFFFFYVYLDYADYVFSIFVTGETVFEKNVIVDTRPAAAETQSDKAFELFSI